MKTVLTLLERHLKKSPRLHYIRALDIGEDPNEMIAVGKFPFLGLYGDQFKLGKIKGMSASDGSTRSTSIIIYVAVNYSKRKLIDKGEKDKPSIWEILDDVWESCRDFAADHKADSSAIARLSLDPSPKTASRTRKGKDGKGWIGEAQIVVTFNRDEYSR